MKYAILTSTSPIKVAAVKEVFPDHEWICIKTPTEIEQPFGISEIKSCNFNRIDSVIDTLGYKALYNEIPILSIESGIYPTKYETVGFSKDNCFEDVANILVRKGKRTEYYWSSGVLIPQQYNKDLAEAYHRGFETTTFGEILAERYQLNAKDWSEQLAGVSRKDQIITGLKKVIL